MSRVFLIVLDGVGIGEMPDAFLYDDLGSSTLRHVASFAKGLKVPNMERMGLGNLCEDIGYPLMGVSKTSNPSGAYARIAEKSKGKDSLTGHFELIGLVRDEPFKLYPEGFPKKLIQEIEEAINYKVLACGKESGTEIIKRLGEESLKNSMPIIYTSADSVLQIAAHEETMPIGRLYESCKITRAIMSGANEVGRVIARPFVGKPGSFIRTEGRKDYCLYPEIPNLLTILKDSGINVMTCGKLDDLFSMCGITDYRHTLNNTSSWKALLDFEKTKKSGLIFTNLIDFDQAYGHRNDPIGFAKALECFDSDLLYLLDNMAVNDLLIITADHGNDPTTKGTDHNREYIPFLAWSKRMKKTGFLGTKDTFCDIGATVADHFDLSWQMPFGASLL